MLYVGLDVAKDHRDVHLRPTGEAFRVAHDDAGVTVLTACLTSLSPILIRLEATGGYEGTVAAALATVGLPVVGGNPRQILRARAPSYPCPQ